MKSTRLLQTGGGAAVSCARRRHVRGQMEGASCFWGPRRRRWKAITTRSRASISCNADQRVDDKKMPFVRVVDMRQSAQGKSIGDSFGATARRDQARLEKREQTILFLNRRGFSTSLLCSVCGDVAECPNCSVALTFHRERSALSCHICGHTAAVPKKCRLRQDALIYSGFGTEKVEANVAQSFPSACPADGCRRDEAQRCVSRNAAGFRAGKIDILVGTQMIAKGLHFPNVTLVGIINADLALHLPDFRAGERTFQLLTQVAGRAGRGESRAKSSCRPSRRSVRPFSLRGTTISTAISSRNGIPRAVRFPALQACGFDHRRSAHEARAQFSAETLARRLKEICRRSSF